MMVSMMMHDERRGGGDAHPPWDFMCVSDQKSSKKFSSGGLFGFLNFGSSLRGGLTPALLQQTWHPGQQIHPVLSFLLYLCLDLAKKQVHSVHLELQGLLPYPEDPPGTLLTHHHEAEQWEPWVVITVLSLELVDLPPRVVPPTGASLPPA